MSERPNLYLVLGVARDAPPAMIRKAYHDRARAAHPDLVGDRGLATMRRLNAAWDVLRDPGRRSAYDSALHEAAVADGDAARDRPRDGGRPRWTGAAGPSPGRPSGSRIDFGLYAGWTLGEIARHDNGYLMWLAERPEGRPYVSEISDILTAMRAPASESRQRRKWFG